MCGLYADLCEEYGIDLPSLEAETVEKLTTLLPAFAQPDNPLDVTGSGFLHGMNEIVQALVDDKNLDTIVTVCIPPQGEEDFFAPVVNGSFLPLLTTVRKPIIPITFREMSDYARKDFEDKGFYYIENPDLGLKALAHLIDYAEFLRKVNGETEVSI